MVKLGNIRTYYDNTYFLVDLKKNPPVFKSGHLIL